MSIPLYGFQEGDTIGLLIFADENDTWRDLGLKLQHETNIRVRSKMNFQVIFKKKVMDLESTVKQSGLSSLDQFTIR